MLFAIHCLDREGAAELRRASFEAHKAYLAASGVKVIISGPLMSRDGENAAGSLLVVEAESLAEVERFSLGDPFRTAQVWERIAIHPFQMRVDNRR